MIQAVALARREIQIGRDAFLSFSQLFSYRAPYVANIDHDDDRNSTRTKTPAVSRRTIADAIESLQSRSDRF